MSLEERIRFHHEIHEGQEVTVSCTFTWGDGRSFRIEQEIRLPDGTLAADISNVGGLLDLKGRRLISDPGQDMAVHGQHTRASWPVKLLPVSQIRSGCPPATRNRAVLPRGCGSDALTRPGW